MVILLAPVTDHAMVTALPGLVNGAPWSPVTGQDGCVLTTNLVMDAVGAWLAAWLGVWPVAPDLGEADVVAPVPPAPPWATASAPASVDEEVVGDALGAAPVPAELLVPAVQPARG